MDINNEQQLYNKFLEQLKGCQIKIDLKMWAKYTDSPSIFPNVLDKLPKEYIQKDGSCIIPLTEIIKNYFISYKDMIDILRGENDLTQRKKAEYPLIVYESILDRVYYDIKFDLEGLTGTDPRWDYSRNYWDNETYLKHQAKYDKAMSIRSKFNNLAKNSADFESLKNYSEKRGKDYYSKQIFIEVAQEVFKGNPEILSAVNAYVEIQEDKDMQEKLVNQLYAKENLNGLDQLKKRLDWNEILR